ncbi:hypothetical protein [Maritimibacter sp. UBA3975]|uniref:hypothetical protein n=1 Tax=Maritimibacter sp. UBA3975 TaxID=1946833 RepID=UPI000C08DD31|nr:hypothetical protein [Maritimibacter sp. UBA3975]MAM62408.1 hypothetical protein [Maritimibacter sp.]
MTVRATIHRSFATALALFLMAVPAISQDDENKVCSYGSDGSRLSPAELGPMIEGQWTGTAPGLGVTTGVQTFPLTITLEYGRLYISSGGQKARLEPVRGPRKALRYDFVKQKAIPEEAHAVAVNVEDFGLVLGCDMNVAPQFTWTFGSGNRRSQGIYSFASPDHALGTMWNSARGAREVYLSR